MMNKINMKELTCVIVNSYIIRSVVTYRSDFCVHIVPIEKFNRTLMD